MEKRKSSILIRYQVSNYGNIKGQKGNILKGSINNAGGGTSDKEEYQKHQSLANQFDEDASLLRDGSGL